jgi:hypothetical protein
MEREHYRRMAGGLTFGKTLLPRCCGPSGCGKHGRRHWRTRANHAPAAGIAWHRNNPWDAGGSMAELTFVLHLAKYYTLVQQCVVTKRRLLDHLVGAGEHGR